MTKRSLLRPRSQQSHLQQLDKQNHLIYLAQIDSFHKAYSDVLNTSLHNVYPSKTRAAMTTSLDALQQHSK